MGASTMSAAPCRRLRGRVQEWQSIKSLLDATAAGRGGLLLVDGAAGTGKTRLLTAAEDRAVGQGFSLRRARDRVDELPESPPNSSADLRPLLVTVDDLPAEDEAAAAELQALPQRLAHCPVSWLVVRRVAVEATPPDWPLDSWDQPVPARVELGPLSAEAVADIGTDVLGAHPDRHLLSVAAGAAGNPMLLVAFFEGLRGEGLVSFSGGRARMVPEQLPERLDKVIDGWLRWLSPAACNMLEVAACLNPSFTLDDLARVLGWPQGKVLAPLHQLVGRALLTLGPQTVLAFQHDLVRQSMLRRVPVPVRSAVSWQLAHSSAVVRTTPDWDLLSAAERSVAELVARGMTNRQAADQLFLSPHTISFHLRKVFRKLGVASRVELTRLVLERDARR